MANGSVSSHPLAAQQPAVGRCRVSVQPLPQDTWAVPMSWPPRAISLVWDIQLKLANTNSRGVAVRGKGTGFER